MSSSARIATASNIGTMMVELCSTIPDGVVAFFTSYSYMESIISEWDGMGIMRQLTKSKLVFIETKDVVETTMALDNFRRACDSGRGAVFLSVARGKVRRISHCFLLGLSSGKFSCTFSLIESRCQKGSTSIDTMDEQ